MCKYKVCYEWILLDITEGILVDGDKLQTEVELASRFNVSINTIRRAINILAAEGYVVSRQGDGLYVKNSNVTNLLDRKFNYEETLGSKFRYVLVDSGYYIAGAKDIKKLDIQKRETIYYTVKLVYDLEKIVGIKTTIVPSKLQIKYASTNTSTVFENLTLNEKNKLSHFVRTVFIKDASPKEKLLLGTTENKVLVVESRGYFKDGHQHEYSEYLSVNSRLEVIVNI